MTTGGSFANLISSSSNGSSIASKYNVFNYPNKSKFEGFSMTDREFGKPVELGST